MNTLYLKSRKNYQSDQFDDTDNYLDSTKRFVWVKSVAIMLLMLFAGSNVFGQSTWYTLASGKWTDSQIWTLDPAGAVPINPSGLYPNLATDNVVVRTGITVTIPDGLTPYNSPLEVKNNLNCGSLTVNGDLDFGVSTGHQFTQIRGNGRLYFEGNSFPTADWTHFVTAGQGGGTIVLRGVSNFSVTTMPSSIYSLEINNSDPSKIYTLDQNLTVTGNLTVESGVLQINGTSTTVRNFTVNGNVNVKTNGKLTTGTATGKVFHWMNVYGDFTNSGVVDFSNSAQYSESTNGAVKLKFLGATDNNFVANGTTDLYRLFVDKGSDQTYTLAVNANNSSNFKLFGTVSGATADAADGTYGWQRLPLVISNGTLKLESNIVISRLGSNITGTSPNEFTIPATAQLYVNGATLTSSNSTGSWNGVTIYGNLKMESGSLTTPSNTNGIFYGSDGTTTPVLEILGGDLYVTQIRPYSSSTKFQYLQSGGIVHFDNLANDNNSSAVFHLNNANHIFEMSGGTMSFKIANAANGWATGIRIESAAGNYSVTGGTIEITENATRDFMIFTTVPLYNITTIAVAGVTTKTQVVDTWGTPGDASWPGDLQVENNLTIASGTQFVDNGGNLAIGGDLVINGTFTQTGKLTFDGAKNATVTNGSGSTFTFGDFNINKDVHPSAGSFYSVGLAGANGYSISKNLNLYRGKLDVVNFNVPISGNIEIVDGDMTSSGSGSLILSGSSLQTIKGASEVEQNFGRLQLNNTSGVKLLSDVNATSVQFNANVLFDLDIYNLDISTANYTSGSWGTSRMFKTSGKVSDGGLTLPIVLSANYGASPGTNVQVFPIGTYNTQGGSTLQYNPAFIDAKGTLSYSGKITIKPVNINHPTVSDASKVIPYYWKVSYTGLSGITASDLRYRFTYAGTIPASVNKGVILNGFAWNEFNSAVSGQTVTFPYTTSFLTVDYSIGNKSAFNAPRVLYSKASGAFNGANTWTLSSTHSGASTSAPNAYDFCIIGGASGANHTVTISANNADASQVYIKGISETGISGTPPTLYVNSGTSGNDIDIISGNGRLVYENNLGYWSDFTLLNGNHADLCNSSEAIIEYTGSGAGPRIIPVSTNIPYYPNLTISGSAGTTQTTNSMNLVVKGNLDVESSTLLLDGNYAEYVKVSNNVIINSGTLTYEPTGIRYMNVDGDIIFTGSGTFNATTGGAENILTLQGNIQQANGTINFGAGGRLLTLALTGTSSSLHTSNSKIADFYRITVNKSSGVKAQFSSDFNLSGATNGATKALTITSGECHLNNSNISIDLSTGGNAFKIPTGTTLRVDNGSRVNVGGSASNTGIWLDGALIADNGGKVYCNQGSGGFTDNYIEYTPAGTASIWLGANAELLVGSQLRRTTTSGAGVLQFTQAKSSSVVTLGINAAPTSNRGVFEILNGGSSFTQTESGSNITIVRGQTAASVSTLLFNPESVSIASGAGFTLGNGSTPASNSMGIYGGAALRDLTIGSNAVVTVKTDELIVGGNLVNSGSLNSGGYNLFLYGNFTNNGTYIPSGNITDFNGSVDQTINGTTPTTFYNLIKGNTNTLVLGSNSVTVTNDLTIGVPKSGSLGGILNTGIYDLSVARNLYVYGTTLSSGASNGIVCNGSALQELTGKATFARLTINNSNGIDVPTQSAAINFTESLHLLDGVFNVGNNLITFDDDAVIASPSGFSATRMVQTNLSFTDNGIRKTFPQGSWSAASPFTFTYPIGSRGKYTPVSLFIVSNGSSNGSIRVKAADERHVSISDDTSTPIDETKNVLQYNWTMDASGLSGFTGAAQMKFIDTDALVTAPNDTSQYITARILLSSTDWNKFDVVDFDGAGKVLNFAFSGTNDDGIDGDYTAGIPACIPDVVPSYISVVENGAWNSASTWATYNPTTDVTGVAGVGVPAGGPRGAVVYLNTTVTMPANFMSAYRTNINPSGVLATGTSFGHRLGDVNGTGLIQMQSGNLPAGVYDHFFSVDGGTLEYTGTGLNYSILSEITSLNNLRLSGTGERNFPNIGFTILGDFTIAGGDCKNPHNTNFDVKGDVIFTSGTFDANTASVTLDGTALQTLSGESNFVAPNEFYNLTVNNSVGVSLLNSVEVDNVLTLTNGVVSTESGGTLTLTNSLPSAIVGGGSSAYVEGVMRKQINNSSYFDFPVGDNSRYGGLLKVSPNGTSQGIWSVRYINGSPAVDGFTAMQAPIVYVSASEYWTVQAPNTSALASLSLPWDSNSGVNPAESGNRVAYYAESPLGWTEKISTFTGTISAGNAQTNSTLSFSGFSGLNRVTFGATSIPAYTWDGSASTDWFTPANWSNDIVPSASSNTTIANTTNKPVISGASVAQTNSLTINLGASLTVAAGGKLTVNGTLTNSGGLVVQNSYNSMASVITKGSITQTGLTTVTNLTPIGAYRYYGFSVSGSNVTSSIWDVANNLTTIGAYYYNDTQYVRFTSNGVSLSSAGSSGSHGVMNGFTVKIKGGPGNQTITSTGVLNSGNISTSLVANKWALLSNPYPSAIDMAVVYANSAANFGAGKIDPTYWSPYDLNGVAAYSTYNLASGIGQNGGSNLVGPQQAYWVKNTSTTTAYSLNLLQSARLHNPSVLKSLSTNSEKDLLRINLVGGAVIDEVVIAFRENGTVDFNEYDSEKRLNTGVTSSNIYTIIGSKFAAIEVQPLIVDESVVPLGVNLGTSAAGNYLFSATNIGSFNSAYDIYLEDLVEGVTYNLREVGDVQCSLAAGITNNRFLLRFSPSSTGVITTLPEFKSESTNDGIVIQQLDEDALVTILDDVEQNAQIEMYAIGGQVLKIIKRVEKSTRVQLPKNHAAYIIRVVNGNKAHSARVVSLGK